MKQQNDAARDLWAQIFERAAADLNAALHEPDEEGEAVQRELATHALKEAGWSETEIERRKQPDRLHGDQDFFGGRPVGDSRAARRCRAGFRRRGQDRPAGAGRRA